MTLTFSKMVPLVKQWAVTDPEHFSHCFCGKSTTMRHTTIFTTVYFAGQQLLFEWCKFLCLNFFFSWFRLVFWNLNNRSLEVISSQPTQRRYMNLNGLWFRLQQALGMSCATGRGFIAYQLNKYSKVSIR